MKPLTEIVDELRIYSTEYKYEFEFEIKQDKKLFYFLPSMEFLPSYFELERIAEIHNCKNNFMN